MFKRIVMSGLMGLMLATPALALDQGDWVLGRWQGGKYWFPGIVQQSNGGQVTIEYDDGTLETLSRKQVKLYDWTIGSRVECDWKSEGSWYGGNITKLSGGNLTVTYDDGSRESTQTGKCRSR